MARQEQLARYEKLEDAHRAFTQDHTGLRCSNSEDDSSSGESERAEPVEPIKAELAIKTQACTALEIELRRSRKHADDQTAEITRLTKMY